MTLDEEIRKAAEEYAENYLSNENRNISGWAFEAGAKMYAHWKDEYENLCKFTTDYETQRDQWKEYALKLREALEKIAEPEKHHHWEKDAYTRAGCFQHVAQEALAKETP